MCDEEAEAAKQRQAAVEQAVQEEAAESTAIHTARSRHKWLLTFNVASIAIGWLALANGTPDMLSGRAHFDNGNSSPMWLAFDLFAALAPIWSLIDSRGFRRGAVASKWPLRRGFYWATAAPGFLVLLVGVVAPLVAYLVVVTIFAVVAVAVLKAEGDRAELVGIARDAARDVLRERW